MAILYKSSKFETYSYFIIYPALIIGMCYFIFKILKYGNFSLFTIGILLVFIYVLILAIDSLYRLRYIEVTEDNIVIKRIGEDKILSFENIEGLYNLITINGNSLIIWYKDQESGKSKSILVRPDEKNPEAKVGFPVYSYSDKELNITEYIKDKAIKANQNYNHSIQPRWFLYGIK